VALAIGNATALATRQAAVVATAVAIAITGDSMLYAVLPTQADYLGLSASAVGLALAVNRFARLATNPLAARLMALCGGERLFIIVLAVSVATTLAWYFPLPVLVLLGTRMLWGFNWSVLRLHGHLAAMGRVAEGRGMRFGLFRGIFRSGSLVAAVTGGMLTDTFGFRAAVAIMALVTLTGIPVYLFLRARYVPAGMLVPSPALAARGNDDAGSDSRESMAPAGSLRRLQSLAANRDLLRIGAGGFLQSLLISTFSTTMGYYLQTRLGGAELAIGIATLSGFLWAWMWLCNILLGPAFGAVADRLGRSRVALGLALLQGLIMVAVGMGGSWAVVVAAIAAGLLLSTGLEVVIDAAAGDTAAASRKQGAFLAGYANFIDAGAALGPVVGFSLGAIVGLPLLYAGGGGLVLIWVLWRWRGW
jgi:MFS family permease